MEIAGQALNDVEFYHAHLVITFCTHAVQALSFFLTEKKAKNQGSQNLDNLFFLKISAAG
ncbi:MAG: hypothetical protein COB15_08015 [Flavobacteriales bacterium]|nr:MAG: hypothetical protein COB15_08015 [Flavobacteriales bacterium]